MSRKLVTIQKIKELNPIPNADSIEVATILGWKVVVRKGEFKVDDLVVYAEIDSLFPEKPEFEFLRERKFRIRTVRLRGQISQGIAFPLSIIENKSGYIMLGELVEGLDVTDFLDITQYIPQIPANISGEVKGVFPNFIPKTDETRVQLLQDVLTRHKGTRCYVTEKVDGCSVTYFYKDGEFGVCSRNLELRETEDNLFWKMARTLKIEEKLKQYYDAQKTNMAIQGELIGMGIQKNNLRLPENKVLFFNVFNIDKFEYLNYQDAFTFLAVLDLEAVPVVGLFYELDDNIDNLIEKSKGFSLLNPKIYREGIVIRPMKELVDLQMSSEFNNGRVSFKAINPEYLLKYEE
jgi:RNA ligase (TIGR02306 family)